MRRHSEFMVPTQAPPSPSLSLPLHLFRQRRSSIQIHYFLRNCLKADLLKDFGCRQSDLTLVFAPQLPPLYCFHYYLNALLYLTQVVEAHLYTWFSLASAWSPCRQATSSAAISEEFCTCLHRGMAMVSCNKAADSSTNG